MNFPEIPLVSDISNDMLNAMLSDPSYGMERKRDGYRLRVIISPNNKITTQTRSGKFYNLPTLLKKSLEQTVRTEKIAGKYILLDGEVLWLDAWGNDHRTKVQAGKDGLIIYSVWDMLLGDGKKFNTDVPYKERKISLINNIKFKEPVVIEPTYVSSSSKSILLQNGKQCNWEGYVFKKLDALYSPGRGEHAYRWKYKVTKDYIVIGYTKSDKDKNPFRALVLAAYKNKELIRKGQCGGGFPDKSEDTEKPTRTEIYNKYLKNKQYWQTLKDKTIKISKKKPEHKMTDKDYKKTYGTIYWLYKNDWFVIEVESQKFTEYGIPYMPQFIRTREDKAPKNCKETE